MENEVVKSEGQLHDDALPNDENLLCRDGTWFPPPPRLLLPPHVTAAAAAVGNCHQKDLSGIQKPECIEVLSSSSSSSIIIIQFCRSLETCFSASIEGCRISQPKMKNKVVKSEGHLHTLITAL
uniref:Uncharacterized protein n=1 Tax=Oryza nivara TaxID=4536 RepID=A0A0E0HF22_ORYNI